MDLGYLAGLLGILGPAGKILYDYLKEHHESKRTTDELRRAITATEDFQSALAHSGKSSQQLIQLILTVDEDRRVATKQEFDSMVRLSNEVNTGFTELTRSICSFAQQCLWLAEDQGFMKRLQDFRPDVCSAVSCFAKGYDPKNDVLDLTGISVVLGRLGKKAVWTDEGRESFELLEMVFQLGTAIDAARRVVPKRSHVGRKRIRSFLANMEALAIQTRRIRIDEDSRRELDRRAPLWFKELTDVMRWFIGSSETLQSGTPD